VDVLEGQFLESRLDRADKQFFHFVHIDPGDPADKIPQLDAPFDPHEVIPEIVRLDMIDSGVISNTRADRASDRELFLGFSASIPLSREAFTVRIDLLPFGRPCIGRSWYFRR
jgi:hypothetical protein